MTGAAAVVVALVAAALVVGAFGPRRTRRAIVGLISKDKRGRTTLVIWPSRGRKRRR